MTTATTTSAVSVSQAAGPRLPASRCRAGRELGAHPACLRWSQRNTTDTTTMISVITVAIADP